MLVLALETSGPTASVAIARDGVLLAEHTLCHTRTHSQTVMPMAERLMEEMDIAPKELSALAVNCGPGSFTGVRIGVATANAMAAALNIPVIGIPSLAALYENVRVYPGPVAVWIDARNDQVYAARFDAGVMAGGPFAGAAKEHAAAMPANTLFVGDGAQKYQNIIREALPSAVIAPEGFAYCRAAALCRMAAARLEGGLDPRTHAQVEPLYLRPPQAERMWAQKHAAPPDAP